MNTSTPEICPLDVKNPLHPTAIQELLYQAQSIVYLLNCAQQLPQETNISNENSTRIIFACDAVCNLLDVVTDRLDKLDLFCALSEKKGGEA